MLDSPLFAVSVGVVLGFLAGLGVGGGSLLLLWLTGVVGMSRDTAAGINLLFFVPTALTASLFRLKQGKLDFPRIFPALLAGVATAGVLTVVARSLDTELLRKPFGILLLVTGLRELLYRRRKAR
jgi:uncharacterized membrane protein YfcA